MKNCQLMLPVQLCNSVNIPCHVWKAFGPRPVKLITMDGALSPPPGQPSKARLSVSCCFACDAGSKTHTKGTSFP